MAARKVLDDVKKREICALVTAGMSMVKVARYVGCSPKTITRAQRSDEEFDQRMRRAKLSADLNPLEAMRRASTTHWRAAAWMLERDERRQADRRAGRTARLYSQEDLLYLAEQVKRIVDRGMPIVFEGPSIDEQIDALFWNPPRAGELKQAAKIKQTVKRAGRKTLPAERHEASSAELLNSMKWLEQRFADRSRFRAACDATDSAASAEETTSDDQPEAVSDGNAVTGGAAGVKSAGEGCVPCVPGASKQGTHDVQPPASERGAGL